MAKKPAKANEDGENVVEEVEEVEVDVQKQILKELEKDFGKGVMIKGNEIVDRQKKIIPVSPALDYILGGGVPEGTWGVLTGKYKSGKSSISLHFAGNCQKPENGSRNVYYLNVEGRLKKRDLNG